MGNRPLICTFILSVQEIYVPYPRSSAMITFRSSWESHANRSVKCMKIRPPKLCETWSRISRQYAPVPEPDRVQERELLARVTLGFSRATRTRTPENPYPCSRVRVLRGTGTGFPPKSHKKSSTLKNN